MPSTLLFVFGCNSHGQLGSAPCSSVPRPRLVRDFCDRKVSDVWCGATRTLIIADGYLYESQGPLGFTRVTVFDTYLSRGRFLAVVECVLFTLVVTSDHRLLIHDAATKAVSELRLAARGQKSGPRVKSLRAGALYAGVLSEAGTVHTLGMNHSLQLGCEAVASTAMDFTPREVTLRVKGSAVGEHVLQLRCGATHAAALTASGHLFLWGANAAGELGFSSGGDACCPASLPVCLTDGSLSPASASFPTFARGSVADVACGDRTTYFVLPSGAMLYCGASCARPAGARGSPQENPLGHAASDGSAPGTAHQVGSATGYGEGSRTPASGEAVVSTASTEDIIARGRDQPDPPPNAPLDDLAPGVVSEYTPGTCTRLGDSGAIRTVSAGGGWQNTHCLVADASLQVYAQGSNSRGQLGIGCEVGTELSSTEVIVDGKPTSGDNPTCLARCQLVAGKYEMERDTGVSLAPSGALRCWVKKTDDCTIALSVSPGGGPGQEGVARRVWKLAWTAPSADAPTDDEPRWEFSLRDTEGVKAAPGVYRTWQARTAGGKVATMDVEFVFGPRQRDLADRVARVEEFTRLPLPFVDKSKVAKISVFAGWLHSAVLLAVDDLPASVHSTGSLPGQVEEVMRHIFSYLTQRDRMTASRTCWRMCLVARHNTFWERAYDRLNIAKGPTSSQGQSEDPAHFFALILAAKKDARQRRRDSERPEPRGVFSDWLNRLLGSETKPLRVLMLGLDAAGKTTILYRLKLGDAPSTIPTIGFNVETFRVGKRTISCWDVGGPDRIRALWKHYYQGTDAIIFVVDSNDRARLSIASRELHTHIISCPDAANIPILVFANKQDGAWALTAEQVSE
eukprot:gene2014-3083_t